jgi:hypothetical protein
VEKKFLTGDGSPKALEAYEQAITEGMIEKGLTVQEFYVDSDHELMGSSEESVIIGSYHEIKDSKYNVANLFKGEEKKREVIKKWFEGV